MNVVGAEGARPFALARLRSGLPPLLVAVLVAGLLLVSRIGGGPDVVRVGGAEPAAWSTTVAISPAAVSTAAGSATAAVTDGTGAAASFNSPAGMSVSGGTGYIYDSGYIRKIVFSTGVVSKVSGDGSGSCADGSAAVAKIGPPVGNSLVNDGNYLYWADSSCQTPGIIREMSLGTGAVTTISGRTASSMTVGPAGTMFFTQSNYIYSLNTGTGSATLVATLPTITYGSNALQQTITGMTADSAHLFVTSSMVDCNCTNGYHSAVTQIDPSTGIVTTLYTQPIGASSSLAGLVVSAGSNLYISTAARHIYRLSKSNGTLVDIAGATYGFSDGTGAQAWFANPTGIDTDGTNLWVSDGANHRIRKLAAGTALADAEPAAWSVTVAISPAAVSTAAGNSTAVRTDGTGVAASFQSPGGMSIAGGYGYLTDGAYIRRIALTTGIVTTMAGGGTGNCTDNIDPAQATFGGAWNNSLANDGTFLYWADIGCGLGSGQGIFRRMSLSSGAISTPGQIYTQKVMVGPGGQLFVAEGSQVSRVNITTWLTTVVATLPSLTYDSNSLAQNITGMTADASHLFVTSSMMECNCTNGYRSAVSQIDPLTGTVTTIYAQPTQSAAALSGLPVSAGSYLYIAVAGRIYRLTKSDGTLIEVAGASGGFLEGTGAQAWFAGAAGIDTDGTNLWVTDSANHRIRELTAGIALADVQPAPWSKTLSIGSGAVFTAAGNSTAAVADGTGTAASFQSPGGMSIAGSFGYLTDGAYIRRITLSSGVVTTVAGGGTGGTGPCPDNADPAQATFGGAWNNSLANDGTFLYWADTSCGLGSGQGILRRMSLSTGAISTLPGPVYARGVTVGPGGQLFDDTGNTIYSVNTVTGMTTLLASLPSEQYLNLDNQEITGLTSDGTSIYATATIYDGNFTYPSYSAVSKINASTGVVTTLYLQPPFTGLTLADGTPANVGGAVVSAGAYLYVSGAAGQEVVRLSKSDGSIANVAGTYPGGYADGTGPAAQFADVGGIDTDGTNLWITDDTNYRIRMLSVASGISRLATSPTASYPANGVGQVEIPGGSAVAESCACSQGSGADPVNTGNGDFYETSTDLQTPGRGPALTISRTYDSFLAGADGPFGHGWSFSYGLFLTADPSTHAVTVHQEDGSAVAFTPGSGLSYSPVQPRMQATFTGHPDGTYTFTRHQRMTYTFNATGQLTAVTDLNGYSTTLGYDTNNHLASITDSAGRAYTVTTAGGRVTKVSDPAARSYSYAYNTAGDLTSVTDPTNAVTTFTYDSAHRLLTTLDPNQQAATTKVPLTNTYDSSGRVTSQSDFLGRTTTFDYTSISGATKVTDPAGRVTVDYYSNGVRTKTTAGYGTASAASTTFTYDSPTGAVATVTDPLNHVTTKTYDGRGNVLTSTDPLHRVTTNTYDGLNDVLTSTDPRGVSSTQTYDSAGNLLTSSRPLLSGAGTTLATRTVTSTYGDAGHPGDVTAITDPNGNTSTASYDTYGDLLSSSLPATPENSAGNKTTHTYNTNTGWLLTTVSPRGNVSGATAATYTTTYGYDGDGRLTSTKDSEWTSGNPSAHQITNTYDADGNLRTVTDPNNRTSTYTYDADNEPITTLEPNGSTQTHQSWNPDGQILTTTDGLGHVTTNTYDTRGDLLTAATPNGRTTTYTYDLAGNITAETAPGAICSGVGSPTAGCVSYAYDADNELISRTYADGGTHNVTAITYDADGRRTGQTDATGTTTATFDSLGRLSKSVDGNNVTVTYGYDLAGNETTVTYPGSHILTYTYDHAERPSTVTDWLSNTATYTYDADNDLASTTYPAGTHETDTNTYNQLDALTAINDTKTVSGTTSTLFAATYTHTNASQISTATTTGITEPNQQYTYNGHNELTTSGASGATTYSYDAADRITNRGTTSAGTASTLTYDNDSQLCWSIAATVASPSCATVPTGATKYTYNATGSRTATTPASGNATSYTYDEEQHLAAYTPPSGTSTTYTYDGSGLRQSKTTGTSTTHYTWNQSTDQPMLLADATNSYIYSPAGWPLEQISTTTNAVTWLHHDQLGSTRLLTDNTGATAGTATYDPFGAPTATTGTVSTPLGFDGQYTDAESGMIYLRARYYDLTTAQFLTIDPLVSQTRQPYSYTVNDPLNGDDPTGLCNGFWNCVVSHGYSALEGAANAVTFGGAAALDEAISPGSTCTYAHDGYYNAGYAAAVVATAVATDGASAEADADVELTTVGRWMSADEHEAMSSTGMVQEGGGGTTFVAHPADPAAYGSQATAGSRYVEFDVPRASLRPAGKEGWAQIPGPNSMYGRLAQTRGDPPPQFPPALNINWLGTK